MPALTLPFTATRVQASTYLFGVALFSISFLVFLNSAVSFVITDRIGQKDGVGDAVGTLGFADELVVVVACPVWGVLSDRIGLRAVAVSGYVIIGIALFLFVQAQNVYPQLLLGRMFFALGAAATSTMVTAILPTMTLRRRDAMILPSPVATSARTPSHNATPSVSSELTITPTRWATQSQHSGVQAESHSAKSTSQLSGIVGMFTGMGALVALGLFLPLPTRFQKSGKSLSEAVADSFYVVGVVALLVGLGCFFGLRNLPGESRKGWRRVLKSQDPKDATTGERQRELPSYAHLLLNAITLGMRDVNVGLGYIGGFVARASSVAISLFIPLFVNQYFITSGRCPADPDASPQDPGEIKRNCQRAYIVASILTGSSQLIALLCAPIFGYLNAHYSESKLPLLISAAAGIAGFSTFGLLQSPDPTGKNGNIGAFIIVALIGISQIGAIVSSLDLISRGVQADEPHEAEDSAPLFSSTRSPTRTNGYASYVDQRRHGDTSEEAPLISMSQSSEQSETLGSRSQLKGSVAGVYSLAGGVGILILTKVGGVLFDKVDVGAPFFMMAGFNALLFILVLASACLGVFRGTGSRHVFHSDASDID